MKNFAVVVAGTIGTNSVVVWNDEEAILIDPAGSLDFWIDYFENFKIPLKAVYITHAHYDHVEAVSDITQYFNIPWFMNKLDFELLQTANMFGVKIPQNPKYYNEGKCNFTDTINGEIFFTSGHSHGSSLFYFPQFNLLITGDTLFKGTIGATHFPFSNNSDMIKSLKKIKSLNIPEDTVVIPGHGGMTTFGDELKTNSFLLEI